MSPPARAIGKTGRHSSPFIFGQGGEGRSDAGVLLIGVRNSPDIRDSLFWKEDLRIHAIVTVSEEILGPLFPALPLLGLQHQCSLYYAWSYLLPKQIHNYS